MSGLTGAFLHFFSLEDFCAPRGEAFSPEAPSIVEEVDDGIGSQRAQHGLVVPFSALTTIDRQENVHLEHMERLIKFF